MADIRFIRTAYNYADFSTSVSPAIELALECRQAPDTVVLNIFDGDSFTVGYFDDPVKSMDLDFCRRENIIVRRRQNGGGAVLGAHGCAFLVFYLDTDHERAPMKTIRDAFGLTLPRLSHSIRDLFGVDAVHRPLNDVEVAGRKIVASSARMEKKILTIRCMINVCPTDRGVMDRAIRVAPEKIKDKKIKGVGRRFTCLNEELGRNVTEKELLDLTQSTVHGLFGPSLTLVPSAVSAVENAYSEAYQKRYTSDDWFFANSEIRRFKKIPRGSIKKEGRHKALAGLIRFTLLIKDNTVCDIIITGDFHPAPNTVLTEMENAIRHMKCDSHLIARAVTDIFNRDDVEITGTTPADFISAFEKALK
ncbi:MAG: hypothetical protein R6U50_03130 [Desulfobacterales bacterium]